ncbi:MAG TPA: hypothetical protein VMT37_05240 [Solirubrobacterales bacterium]|nr:hypothetical protein [Solirubrobacterales bacterium]
MNPTRRILLVLSLAAAAVCLGAGPAAASYHLAPPKAGVWKFGSAGDGGMSLTKGRGAKKGKLFVSGIHTLTQNYVGCPDDPQKIEVLGRFQLKLVPLTSYPGYAAWGVGKKAPKGDEIDKGVAPISARVKVDGKLVSGGQVKLEFSAVEANTFGSLWIEFPGSDQTCVTPIESAKHG